MTGWPGYFPNGPAVVALLLDASGDPNVPVEGSWHAETPLHWAASSDDVEVARALIDGGADLEAAGASIAAALPWTMPSATAAGRSRGCSLSAAHASSGFGTPPRWGCSDVAASFWPSLRRHPRSSPMPSGSPVMAVSDEWPNTCFPSAPI